MVEHPAVNGRVIGSSPIVGVFFTAFFSFILRHSDVRVPPASPVHSTRLHPHSLSKQKTLVKLFLVISYRSALLGIPRPK